MPMVKVIPFTTETSTLLVVVKLALVRTLELHDKAGPIVSA